MVKLWVDFNNNSENGVRLNCQGTKDDLLNQKIELKEGMQLLIWDKDFDDNNRPDNLIVEAVAKYNYSQKVWEAVFEWEKIKHESDLKK